MSQFHTSLKRLLSGATLSGFLSAEGSPEPRPVTLDIKRLDKSRGPHDWQLHVAIQAVENTVECDLAVDVQWAGSTPVISLHEASIPGVGTVNAKILINNCLFAGTWVHEGIRGEVWGEVWPLAEAVSRKERFVIERSSEFLREWWTGSEWSEAAETAHWYKHEPDGPRITGDEGAHAVCYPSGEVEPG